ncbi:lysoplasmalogenase [Sinisalibacter aestuarii]|uniref:Lysoplasmalogenase n=1 Tax=Sinisalibacter aestuarii TaxID=2949426 RepID=A0ABQ5LSM6_9RHOB|nr:lysoplasmalogenase [Sinisalibacter aestuarii]GKY87251.1 lysoplasmalogenase [Sinisalibacter aestuarii]
MSIILLWFGLAVALVYLPMTAGAPSWPRSAVKTVPLLVFTFTAWAAGGAPWLVAGLFFSALGDFALSRKGEAAFLYGLASFALAHIAYILLFLVLSAAPLWAAFSLQPVLAVALLVHGVLAEIWLVPHVDRLRWPVRLYVVAITLMGLAVLTLPLGAVTLGALFFIASDTMLAVQLFRLGGDNPLTGPLGWGVWVFYVIGQALILAGTL